VKGSTKTQNINFTPTLAKKTDQIVIKLSDYTSNSFEQAITRSDRLSSGRPVGYKFDRPLRCLGLPEY
jgi:hypothetical protein